MNPPDPLAIARKLLAVPTAPFYEQRVMAVIRGMLDDWGIRYQIHPHGNLIARFGRAKSAPWALLAHTDHPGIEITSVRGHVGHGTFLGGVRPDSLPGATVRLYGDGGEATGTIETVRLVHGEKRIRVRLDQGAGQKGAGQKGAGQKGAVQKGWFGSFDLGPPTVNRQRICAIAVDDLIGCATVISVLGTLKAQGATCRVLGVFTRAEEVGFAGAQKLVANRTLPDHARIVSLEASMEMAGARQNKGPVIRVGDRTATFDAGLERVLHETAQGLKAADPTFKFQRQLMSGGTCEATVFTAAGYKAVGLAYPLMNYHNMAAPDGVAKEEVASADYLGGVRLLVAAVQATKCGGFPRYLAHLTRATAKMVKRL